MYLSSDYKDVEEICYDSDHIKKVLTVIKMSFYDYFDRFLETRSGIIPSAKDFNKLQKIFRTTSYDKKTRLNLSNNYKNIIIAGIENFEEDRENYKKILDEESLEEYEDDVSAFKNTILKNKCPIIRKTILNKKAKELDKYRANFSKADPNLLLRVIKNISEFAAQYKKNYDNDIYDNIKNLEDLKMEILDTDDYTAYGVIGGGIKTHMLYKVYPEIFPNRSRDAIWALWFLSKKKKFDCETDSEFLMIDTDKTITQQNYFYPYSLFSYYAFEIYKLLKEKAIEHNLEIDPNYRYVIVDSFLKFVSSEHDDEIDFFKSQIRDGGIGFA